MTARRDVSQPGTTEKSDGLLCQRVARRYAVIQEHRHDHGEVANEKTVAKVRCEADIGACHSPANMTKARSTNRAEGIVLRDAQEGVGASRNVRDSRGCPHEPVRVQISRLFEQHAVSYFEGFVANET